MQQTSKKDLKKIEKILNKSLKRFGSKLERSGLYRNSIDCDAIQEMHPFCQLRRHTLCNLSNCEKLQKRRSYNRFSLPFIAAFLLLGAGCIVAVLAPLPSQIHAALFILVLLLVVPIYCFFPKGFNKRAKVFVLVVIFTCLIVSFAQVQPKLILRAYQQILFDKLSANTPKSAAMAPTLSFP